MTIGLVALVVLAIVCIVAGVAVVARRRAPRVTVAQERPDVLDVAPVRSPAVAATEAPAAPAEPPITWTLQLTAATLDEAARVRLIDDLVLLRAAWAVETLRRARAEEQAPHVRARIEEALIACGQPVESGA